MVAQEFEFTGHVVKATPSSLNDESNECSCCDFYDLEQGDTLYTYSDWDGGIEFGYIREIKYCPVCGKKLPGLNDVLG